MTDKVLLALANTTILDSESRGTQDLILGSDGSGSLPGPYGCGTNSQVGEPKCDVTARY
jgi:hypothetical protein